MVFSEVYDNPLTTASARLAVVGVGLKMDPLGEGVAVDVYYCYPPTSQSGSFGTQNGVVEAVSLTRIGRCDKCGAPVFALYADLQPYTCQLVWRFEIPYRACE